MIEDVSIMNFQSHKQTVLEFVPGVNVIIGESDAGKSAVFRAINWAASNRPLGDAFRSEWGGDTKVILHTTEGNTIERTRSATKNEYVLNGKPLRAFGSEVPEEVGNTLQLDPANIQAQMDSPFLLAISPGEAARMLNKAASIDDIDYTVSGIKKSLNKLNSSIQHNEQQLAEYQEQMRQYENLPEVEQAVKQAEESERVMMNALDALRQLEDKAYRLTELVEELELTRHVPELLEKCRAAEKLNQAHQEKAEKHRQLYKATVRLKSIQSSLRHTAGVDQASPILNNAIEQQNTLKKLYGHRASLQNLANMITNTTKQIGKLDKQLIAVEQEFHKLAPDTCPLCGNEMERGAS